MENELYHHGVKGMKWGVRRDRKKQEKQLAKQWAKGSPKNTVKVKAEIHKDGSATVTEYRVVKKKKNKTRGWSKDAKRANSIKKKSVKQMSNAELKELNKRMELESNYRRLNPNKVKTGLAYVGMTAGAMGTVISLYNNSNTLINIGKKFLNR